MKIRNTIATLVIATTAFAGTYAATSAFAQRGEKLRQEKLERFWDANTARPTTMPPDFEGGPDFLGAPFRPFALYLKPFWDNERIAEALELSEDQIASLEESGEITQEALESTEGSILQALAALKEELEKDNPDLSTTLSLSDEVTAALDEKSENVLGHVVTVKTVLTVEQEEKLKEIVRQRIRGEVRRGGRGVPRRGGSPTPGGPGGPDIEEFRNLMDEVRTTLQEGGTLDDVRALLEANDVPPKRVERIVKGIERRIERRGDR